MGGAVVATHGGERETFEEACAIIGVEPEASWEEIDRLYKIKVQYAHPDKGGDPERFKRIQKAYDYLKKVKGG
jgi:curved DNA-binding protein CbpA